MSIDELETMLIPGWTAIRVRVTYPGVEDAFDGWELGCDTCDWFGAHLTRDDVLAEVNDHQHWWRHLEDGGRHEAILADHRLGLHEEHDDPIDGCRYPGCEDAFWWWAREQEATPDA